uniref:Ubiquitin-conjugating enzyme E2 27-like n=1 Tax=Nicotiana tabacum TaxID=4097 RepID=A0A1S4A703_TOBAC|nr:PREDICTED: ubiquitin-conjugating enzyme E2 27-like [Nicotiana tabacum]
MVDLARVQKELQECNRDVGVSGISVTLKGDSLTHLIGTIPGPLGTPYEGGSFKIDITLTDGYPFEPPKMRFATKVWYEKQTCSIISFYSFFSFVVTGVMPVQNFIW